MKVAGFEWPDEPLASSEEVVRPANGARIEFDGNALRAWDADGNLFYDNGYLNPSELPDVQMVDVSALPIGMDGKPIDIGRILSDRAELIRMVEELVEVECAHHDLRHYRKRVQLIKKGKPVHDFR